MSKEFNLHQIYQHSFISNIGKEYRDMPNTMMNNMKNETRFMMEAYSVFLPFDKAVKKLQAKEKTNFWHLFFANTDWTPNDFYNQIAHRHLFHIAIKNHLEMLYQTDKNGNNIWHLLLNNPHLDFHGKTNYMVMFAAESRFSQSDLFCVKNKEGITPMDLLIKLAHQVCPKNVGEYSSIKDGLKNKFNHAFAAHFPLPEKDEPYFLEALKNYDPILQPLLEPHYKFFDYLKLITEKNEIKQMIEQKPMEPSTSRKPVL